MGADVGVGRVEYGFGEERPSGREVGRPERGVLVSDVGAVDMREVVDAELGVYGLALE